MLGNPMRAFLLTGALFVGLLATAASAVADDTTDTLDPLLGFTDAFTGSAGGFTGAFTDAVLGGTGSATDDVQCFLVAPDLVQLGPSLVHVINCGLGYVEGELHA